MALPRAKKRLQVARRRLRKVQEVAHRPARQVQVCPICNEEYTPERLPLVHAPCGHVACASCSMRWQNRNSARTCAFCREPVVSTAHCKTLSGLCVAGRIEEGALSDVRAEIGAVNHHDLNALPGDYKHVLRQSALQRAVRKGDLSMLKKCISSLRTRVSASLLCRVAGSWRGEPGGVLSFLLANGGKIDGTVDSRPLLHAIYHGNLPMARQLLVQRADVKKKNESSETALHVAVRRRRLDIVGVLLCLGADMEAKDRKGRTPAWLAERAVWAHESRCTRRPQPCRACDSTRLIFGTLRMWRLLGQEQPPVAEPMQQTASEESDNNSSSVGDSDVSDFCEWVEAKEQQLRAASSEALAACSSVSQDSGSATLPAPGLCTLLRAELPPAPSPPPFHLDA